MFDRCLQYLYVTMQTCLVLAIGAYVLAYCGLLPERAATWLVAAYFVGLGLLLVWACCYAALDIVKRFTR